LIVDFNRRNVTLAGREIDLTRTEFEIIAILIQNPGKVVTRRQLINKVWGPAFEEESILLRVNMSKKLTFLLTS